MNKSLCTDGKPMNLLTNLVRRPNCNTQFAICFLLYLCLNSNVAVAQSNGATQRNVERIIAWDRRFEGATVECDAQDGIIKLRGTAPSAGVVSDLLEQIRKIRGVKTVVSDIKVVPRDRIDEEIRQGVLRRLDTGQIASEDVAVSVKLAVVELHGQVTTPEERQRVERLAKSVLGVERIVNRLVLGDPVTTSSDAELEQLVETTIRRNALIGGDQLKIVVANQKVTLQGVVATAFEKMLAVREAQNVAGPFTVVDEIEVDPDLDVPLGAAEVPEDDGSEGQSAGELANRIRRNIKVMLSNDPRVSIQDLAIEVDEEFVATIRGSVDSLYERLLAGRLAVNVAEATGVINGVDVKVSPIDDSELTKTVAAAIANDSRLHGSRLTIDVENGHVRLEGDLSPTVDRNYLQQLLGLLPGVLRIEDNSTMTITEPVPDDKLTDVLLNRMAANGLTRGQSVVPDVKDGVVTLTGHVQHLYQRVEAERIARFTEGVRNVTSELQVRP